MDVCIQSQTKGEVDVAMCGLSRHEVSLHITPSGGGGDDRPDEDDQADDEVGCVQQEEAELDGVVEVGDEAGLVLPLFLHIHLVAVHGEVGWCVVVRAVVLATG